MLEALRALGPDRAELEIAGSTGTRSAHRLFRRLRAGLQVTMQPQDPVPVYRRAELLVFPSLHDGFGFAVAEAMACGLPVIVTSNTGASDWVTPECGWVVAPGDADGLAGAIAEAAGVEEPELPSAAWAAASWAPRCRPKCHTPCSSKGTWATGSGGSWTAGISKIQDSSRREK